MGEVLKKSQLYIYSYPCSESINKWKWDGENNSL